MEQMNHLMIDLETLGKGTNAPVVSIGACIFNPDTREISGFKFRASIQIDEALKNRTPDASTLNWWMGQDDAAKRGIFTTNPDKIGIKEALINLAAFIETHEIAYVWGNGATFDITLLETLYEQYEIKVPWPFWAIRDVRTVVHLASPDVEKSSFPFKGTQHDALDDAIHQAKYVSTMWQHLKAI